VSDDFRPFCEEVVKEALKQGIRAEVDQGGRSIGKQIKIANQEKVPMLAVIGENEVNSKTITCAMRKGGDIGTMPIAEAVQKLADAVAQAVEPAEV
tara:strand:+ start:84 stop:371 length:288 start_codon:yes stop_codon:yes gene_type:complete